MTRKILYICLLALLVSCSKDKFKERPHEYFDSFDTYSTQEDLILEDNSRWSFFQLTYPENSVTLDSNVVHSGKFSIKFNGVKTENNVVSKASISKNKMAFFEEDVFIMDAWYFIEGTQLHNWLFIFDLEENVNIGAGPGMRLVLVNNQLRVEHKYLNPDIIQPEGSAIDFPQNQWVNVKFEAKLSQKKNGYVRVWQDGVKIIEQDNWQTLPTDILYFQQGTKGMYTNIEFGITAAGQSNATMYVDDIQVLVSN